MQKNSPYVQFKFLTFYYVSLTRFLTSFWQFIDLQGCLLTYFDNFLILQWPLLTSFVLKNIFYKSCGYHKQLCKKCDLHMRIQNFTFFTSFLPLFGPPVTSNYIYVVKIMYSIWFLGILKEFMSKWYSFGHF